MRFSLFTIVMAAAAISACTRIPVEVSEVKRQPPVEIRNTADLAPIKLGTVGINIRRGTAIGIYKLVPFKCSVYVNNVFWNQGRIKGKDLEFEDLFYEEMKAANFNVVGNPKNIFQGNIRDEVIPAYFIGAQIEEIKMEVCDNQNWWDGSPLNLQNGKGSIKVRWQVFTPFNKKVVYKTETSGMADIKTPSPSGEMVIITEAFAEATANLAADKKLVALLSKDWRANSDIRAVKNVILKIPEQKLYRDPIAENIDRIRLGSVTIDTGQWHGSGVFISPTLILTNHHVVEGQSIVRVTLLTGRKILGEVIRRHPERDVALVQVEKSGYPPMPIRMEPLKIAEEIYAIGSPLVRRFSGTVTKGIVSRYASNKYGLEDIQADVDIQGGNSGGPLVDRNGNLVGLSYAGIGPGKMSIGLNFFIPIYDAIGKLNIKFRKYKRTAK